MSTELLIDLVVIAGVVTVLPLALGRPARWWGAAAGAMASLLVPTGPVAAAFAAGWVVVSVTVLIGAASDLRSDGRMARELDPWVGAIVAGFAVVASLAFVASRGGVVMFDIREPIVELTAVHFTYAGVGALSLARAGLVRSPRGRRPLALLSVALTSLAPPLVAAGFVFEHPVPQVGGAVVMATGVLCTAAVQLFEEAASSRWDGRRLLLVISGVAPWVPMALALAWASSNYWRVPALSIADMVRAHGSLQVVFVLAGLVARRGSRMVTGPVTEPLVMEAA